MTIIAHPRRRSCCQPCDAVIFHFAGDDEIHVYVETTAPQRLAGRLARLVSRLVENPTAVLAITGTTDSPLIARRRQ